MRNSIIESVEKAYIKKRPNFAVGDRIVVNVKLKEGDKERLQAFKGLVISKQPKSGKGASATFTVRKISEGVGVERIFPVNSPSIDSIHVEASSDVRRSRLYYLRSLKGKRARLKESVRFGDLVVDKEEPKKLEVQGTEITDSKSEAPAPAEASPSKSADKKPETKKK